MSKSTSTPHSRPASCTLKKVLQILISKIELGDAAVTVWAMDFTGRAGNARCGRAAFSVLFRYEHSALTNYTALPLTTKRSLK
jgi:hypothetical protein